MNQKLLALYGLKYNPFISEVRSRPLVSLLDKADA